MRQTTLLLWPVLVVACWVAAGWPSDDQPGPAPTPEPAPASKAVWGDLPALRPESPSLPKLLAEVDAHVPSPSYWKSSDIGNWTHEGTHGVNARIRQQFGRPGFYLGGDRALLASHPRTTIREVAKLIPSEFQGFVYKTYCVGQAGSWNNEPLYLWDEWSAYVAGAVVDPNRRQTLSEYLPIGLTVPLAAELDDATEGALAELLARSLPHLDPSHRYVQALRTGASGEPYRKMLQKRGLSLDPPARHP